MQQQQNAGAVFASLIFFFIIAFALTWSPSFAVFHAALEVFQIGFSKLLKWISVVQSQPTLALLFNVTILFLTLFCLLTLKILIYLGIQLKCILQTYIYG